MGRRRFAGRAATRLAAVRKSRPRLEQHSLRPVGSNDPRSGAARHLGLVVCALDLQHALRICVYRAVIHHGPLPKTNRTWTVTPTVSVVIPTIGRASLDRAVRSALSQTRP